MEKIVQSELAHNDVDVKPKVSTKDEQYTVTQPMRRSPPESSSSGY